MERSVHCEGLKRKKYYMYDKRSKRANITGRFLLTFDVHFFNLFANKTEKATPALSLYKKVTKPPPILRELLLLNIYPQTSNILE